MEKVKAMIPNNLKESLSNSKRQDLPVTCSIILEYLLQKTEFTELVHQLTETNGSPCAKDSSVAALWKSRGNSAFAAGDYENARHCYTQALRHVPLSSGGIDRVAVSALFTNRATAMHKMGMLAETVSDCSRAINILSSYSKAWYRRGQAHAQLKNFTNAISDMNVALALESSTVGKVQIKKKLSDTMESFNCLKESAQSIDMNTQRNSSHEDSASSSKMEANIIRALTDLKGWEMQAKSAIRPGDLLLQEEPYAALILKHCRETHCHYCFHILPGDCIPCEFCSIPLFCSESCRENAGGSFAGSKPCSSCALPRQCFDNSCHEFGNLTLEENNSYRFSLLKHTEEHWPEHMYECGGMSWSAVLPVEICLAARMIIRRVKMEAFKLRKVHTDMFPDLCEHYDKMKSEDKLELHVLAVVLALCLHSSNKALFLLTGTTISMIVTLIAQVKINAMAIVQVTSAETANRFGISSITPANDQITCSVEQVQVAQAIYLKGSMFNHSCDPNVHASFFKRSLSIHAIADVNPGLPLELCYGPQVGETRLEDRQKWLKERYMFSCVCRACSQVNFSDLALSSFKCPNHACNGIVLNGSVQLERALSQDFIRYVHDHCWELKIPAGERELQRINEIAHLLLSKSADSIIQYSSCQCLCCGLTCDLKEMQEKVNQSWEHLWSIGKRIHPSSLSEGALPSSVYNALEPLKSLRSVLHPFNKDIAKEHNLRGSDYANHSSSLCKRAVIIEKRRIVGGMHFNDDLGSLTTKTKLINFLGHPPLLSKTASPMHEVLYEDICLSFSGCPDLCSVFSTRTSGFDCRTFSPICSSYTWGHLAYPLEMSGPLCRFVKEGTFGLVCRFVKQGMSVPSNRDVRSPS